MSSEPCDGEPRIIWVVRPPAGLSLLNTVSHPPLLPSPLSPLDMSPPLPHPSSPPSSYLLASVAVCLCAGHRARYPRPFPFSHWYYEISSVTIPIESYKIGHGVVEPGSEAHPLVTRLDVSAAETGPSSGTVWQHLCSRPDCETVRLVYKTSFRIACSCLFLPPHAWNPRGGVWYPHVCPGHFTFSDSSFPSRASCLVTAQNSAFTSLSALQGSLHVTGMWAYGWKPIFPTRFSFLRPCPKGTAGLRLFDQGGDSYATVTASVLTVYCWTLRT